MYWTLELASIKWCTVALKDKTYWLIWAGAPLELENYRIRKVIYDQWKNLADYPQTKIIFGMRMVLNKIPNLKSQQGFFLNLHIK
jgi:hypothetical protein